MNTGWTPLSLVKHVLALTQQAVGRAPTDPEPIEWEPFDGPLTERPKNRKELIELLGDPTRGGLYLKKPDPVWVKKNIVEAHDVDAFIKSLEKTYYPCHKLLQPYFREAHRRAEIAHPGYIQRKGTYGWVFRHIRHRPEGPLSIHSYGAAGDVNPADNRGKELKKYVEPWSKEWRKIWPRGVSKAVVLAFESCGFSWGGWWKDYTDPMHFEWMGRREVSV